MSFSEHKARSLDRSSSSSESRSQQQTRSKSEPQKSSSNKNPLSSTTEHRNLLTVSTGICDLPDFYSIILGPTADETLLVGLDTLLKLGFGCNTEGYTTAASEPSSLGNIQKDTDESSQSEKSYNTEDSEQEVSADDENVGEYSIGTSKQLQSVDYEVKIIKSEITPQTEQPTPAQSLTTIIIKKEAAKKTSTSPSRVSEDIKSSPGPGLNKFKSKEEGSKLKPEPKQQKEKIPYTKSTYVDKKSMETKHSEGRSRKEKEILDVAKSGKNVTPAVSKIKKERHSATFDAIDEEKDNVIEQPIEDTNELIVEATVQSIRELHKPKSLEMIISISSEYPPEEVESTNSIDIRELPKPPSLISTKSEAKETTKIDENKEEDKSKTEKIKPQKKRESYSIETAGSRSPSRAPSETKPSLKKSGDEKHPMEENTRRGSSRSNSLEKRVLISNLKATPKEDHFNYKIIEDENDVEPNVEEPKEIVAKQPSIEENGSQTSALLSRYKIIVESGNTTSEIVVEEKVPEIIDDHSEEKLDENIVVETEGPAEISSKRASVESSRRSSRADSQATLSIEIIKKSPVGSQNASFVRQNASKMSHELTSIIPEDSEENDGTTDGSDESESAADKPTAEESDYAKNQDDRSIKSPGLESTDLPSIHSKLSGNKNGINWKSNESNDVADRVSKKSEKDSRGSIKSFDRTSRGSKSFRNSYETSFDNVKVKISEETIEEVTEVSDEDEKLEDLAEPEQSSKSVPTLESTEIEKPIKSKSSISVKVSEGIVEENIPEKPEQTKRKSKQSLTKSPKKSKPSVSDTKVKSRSEITVELTEETVESDYSTGSKKSDKRRPKRNNLYKKSESYSKSTGPSSPVSQLRKSSQDKSSSASFLRSSTTSSSKTDSYTYTCNIKGDIDVCQSGDSNSKCACSICSDKKLSERYSQIPCPFIRPCIKTTVRKLNGACSCCRSAVPDEISGNDHKKQTLCFDCYTSTSSTAGTDSETSKWLKNGAIAKGQVRYAITKITEYGKFTTFEIMKSTRKIPKFMPARLEGVFVLKHKM